MNRSEYNALTLEYVLGDGEPFYYETDCPECGGKAKGASYERAEGSVNVYKRISCHKCGYRYDEGMDY